jgi:hypothetical protein
MRTKKLTSRLCVPGFNQVRQIIRAMQEVKEANNHERKNGTHIWPCHIYMKSQRHKPAQLEAVNKVAFVSGHEKGVFRSS